MTDKVPHSLPQKYSNTCNFGSKPEALQKRVMQQLTSVAEKAAILSVCSFPAKGAILRVGRP